MWTPHRSDTVAARTRHALALLALACVSLPGRLEGRWRQARASGDRGSETVEKAVIVAVALGLAVGLAAAITAVVNSYQTQITP
ncbi:hypothetical protein [Haloechinothrix halophila]|uniref:hypothetical protein n=1 Tax=Haloechinothrix halophila TaxID=1069073 RepID=UPI000421B172|nr:hypothetical protein [Haloechinothrix halophila]